MPAANISADLRQTAVNSGDFHIRSFDTIASRDATASEGTIRTGDLAFVQATGLYYQWDGAAFQNFGFPGVIEPASPSLTIVTTQQQLDDAINAIPDQFAGSHVIEVRASGLAISRSNFPQPRFDSNGNLDIVADRSSPVVSNAAPSFVLDPNFATQREDPAFGAHTGIAAGTHWIEEDVSLFGAGYTTLCNILLPSVSPAVRFMPVFVLGAAATVYPVSTTLNVFGGPLAPSPYLDGGGRANKWGFGVRLIGFNIDFATSGGTRAAGVSFFGCNFLGFARFEDCLINGHIGPLASASATFTSVRISAESPRIEGLHLSGGLFSLFGEPRIAQSFAEVGFSLRIGCNPSLSAMDFRVIGNPCFSAQGNNKVNAGNAQITVGTQGSGFVEPAIGLTYLPRVEVFFDPDGTITGTVVDAFVIQNGGSLINADDACEGTLVATGDEVLLDGVPLTYLDGVVGVFSLDTGSFMRS